MEQINTVYILGDKIKERNYDGIVLSEEDFHPCVPFFYSHGSIRPESIKRIVIKGVLEQFDYIRCLFRYCDYMLSVGGVLSIEFFNKYVDGNSPALRGRGEWLSELSLVFRERILMTLNDASSDKGFFQFEKTQSFLPPGDTIDRWSFGIVSNGSKNERILEIIKRIESFKIPEFEIIICGPRPSLTLPPYVRVISDDGLYKDIRIPISKKKNLIIKNAQYNNLIVMHDRIMLSKDWFQRMKQYGNYYDILCCMILNEDEPNRRMNDWLQVSYPPIRVNSIRNLLYRRNILNYNEWTSNIYIAGGFFQIKKHFGLYLDPALNWLEKEDVNFSVKAYLAGALFEFNPFNEIYSLPAGFKGSEKIKTSLFYRINAVVHNIIRYYIDNKQFSRYLKRD